MNREQLASGDNGTSELDQSQIIGGFLFAANEEFAKAIHERMDNLHNSAAGAGVGMPFQFHLLLTARTNMRSIMSGLHLVLVAGIPRVHA